MHSELVKRYETLKKPLYNGWMLNRIYTLGKLRAVSIDQWACVEVIVASVCQPNRVVKYDYITPTRRLNKYMTASQHSSCHSRPDYAK